MTDDATLDGGSTDAAEVVEVGGASSDVAADADAAAEVDAVAVAALDPGDASLLALIDRLGSLLDRSDLSELAVESGGTRLVLRKPAAVAPVVAAGAIEAIITIQTIREGCVPPTINLHDPDPAAEGLDLTPNVARRLDVPIALSNSFGFGGQNTALIFRRWVE